MAMWIAIKLVDEQAIIWTSHTTNLHTSNTIRTTANNQQLCNSFHLTSETRSTHFSIHFDVGQTYLNTWFAACPSSFDWACAWSAGWYIQGKNWGTLPSRCEQIEPVRVQRTLNNEAFARCVNIQIISTLEWCSPDTREPVEDHSFVRDIQMVSGVVAALALLFVFAWCWFVVVVVPRIDAVSRLGIFMQTSSTRSLCLVGLGHHKSTVKMNCIINVHTALGNDVVKLHWWIQIYVRRIDWQLDSIGIAGWPN